MAEHTGNSRIIRHIQDVLATQPSLRIAYLYGSFLRTGDFRDIDIALLIDDGLCRQDASRLAASIGTRLEEALGFRYECDVRVLNDAPVWFKYETISTGIPVYVRDDDDRIDFETGVLVEYQDIRFMYDQFDREYLARV